MGTSAVLKGALWLYIGSLLFSLLGLLYWLIVSFYIEPNIVGTAAAIMSYVVLIITIISLGVPRGIQRFFGRTWDTNKRQMITLYMSTALTFLIIVCVPVVLFLFIFRDVTINFLNLNDIELVFVCLLILLDFWPPLFYSLFKSIQRAEIAAFADIMLSVTKLVLGVFLLNIGFGLTGLLLSFLIGSIVRSFLLLYFTKVIFRKYNLKFFHKPSMSLFKELLPAGTAYWVPNTLLVLGQSISVLFLYGAVSNYQTGLYFIAFSISLIVYNLSDSILGLMFPYLSGLKSGKEKAISWALRISLVATVAPSIALIVYSSLPVIILGASYSGAADILRILILGAIIHPIITGYTIYIYAEGRYFHVVIIGIVTTIGRILLYFFLGPTMGAIGVAFAYVTGSVLSLIPLYVSSRIMGFTHDLAMYAKIILIPLTLGIVLFITSIHWLFGLPIFFCTTLILYIRLHVINKVDLIEIAEIFLSRDSIARISIHVRPLIRVLFEE